MSCCCENKYKICDPVFVCDADSFLSLFTGLGIPNGNYIIRLDYLGSVIDVPIIMASGVATFPEDYVLALNESFSFTGQVLDDDGEVVPVAYEDVPDPVGPDILPQEDPVTYDCFEFRTAFKY